MTTMRFYVLLFCSFTSFWATAQMPSGRQSVSFSTEKFTLYCTVSDSALASALMPVLNSGVDSVELFFGHPFPKKFEVFVFLDRAALDRQW